MHKIKFVLLGMILFTSACGKDSFQIGRDNPEKEIEKCTALSQKKSYEKAVQCLEIFKSRFPQTPQGQEAQLKIADAFFSEKEYLMAADTYQTFVKMYPYHANVDYALYRAGMSFRKEAPKAIDRDPEYLIKAHEQLKEALKASRQNSPYHPLIVEELATIENQLMRREFYIGRFYYHTKEYISAAGRFTQLAKDYPDGRLAPQALAYAVECNLRLKKLEEARQSVEILVTKFPGNRWTKKAENHYIRKAQSKS